MSDCQICGRALDVEGDPDSLDCGGDCLGCMNELEGRDLESLLHARGDEWEIRQVVREVSAEPGRPKIVVEIGAHEGGSLAIWQAAWAPELLIGIEPVEESAKAASALVPEAFVCQGTSAESYKGAEALFSSGGRSIDFLYIDGDHTLPTVMEDFETYGKLVRPGGVIALHDACIVWNETVDTYKIVPGIQQRYRTKLIFQGGRPDDPYCPTTGVLLVFP